MKVKEERPMQQQLHVVFQKGKLTVRRPWKGRKVEKFYSAGKPKDNIPAMFGLHEKRQFLEQLGPFIVVTVEHKKKGLAAQILSDGYYIVEHPDTHVKSKWYVAGYYVRDDSAVYIMTPFPMTDAEFFTKLGLKVDLEGKWGNSRKVGKYMKRLYSHHYRYFQGTVIHEGDNTIQVKLDSGEVISVKYADHGKLTDGMNLVSSRFMKSLGERRTVGQGLRITALSPKGFSKGHAIVLPDLHYDLVLFNSKKMLFGERFTFGFDKLHDGGAVFTDVQSYLNFRFVEQDFLTTCSKEFLESVDAAIKDDEKLKLMLKFYDRKFHMKDIDGDDTFIEEEEDWALTSALRHGVDHRHHPALVRKMFNMFSKTIMKLSDLRAPIPEHMGSARYAMVDPTIFDVWGDPVLDGILKGNTVHCGGHAGEIAFHRQPNGHRNEHHIATSVVSTQLSALDSGCFMFLSRDTVIPSLQKLGGGDQDDRLVYYINQSIVKHFKQLELDLYPVVKTEVKPQLERKANMFEHLKLRKPVYDRTQLLVMLDEMQEDQVSIGYVVNAIMQDTCISDHLEQAIEFASHLPREPKNIAAENWLRSYPKYVLRDPATNLEVVIDAVKKDGADIITKKIGDAIKKFNDSFMATPEFLTRGGKFNGRVPQSRRGDSHPITFRCKIDDELSFIETMRKDLEDVITDNSWQMLQPLPLEILTYPMGDVEPIAHDLMRDMRQFYFEQWDIYKKDIKRTKDDAESKSVIKAYKEIDQMMVDKYGKHPLILDAIVLLYGQIYKKRRSEAPRNEDGELKKFADGILWGPQMSKLTIKMLEKVGLAGRYVPVRFEPEFKRLNKEGVSVVVAGGIVRQEGTNQVIGQVDPMADGAGTIERGYAFVKADDAYPYEGPEPTYMVLTVVNGWESKQHKPEEIIAWRKQEHKAVMLVPYTFTNERGEEEHAVRVMLDNKEYGNVSRKDNVYITEPTKGHLYKGQGPMSMSVMVEE